MRWRNHLQQAKNSNYTKQDTHVRYTLNQRTQIIAYQRQNTMSQIAESQNTASSTNDCGHCTYCCNAMKVREIDKPANTWCTHCIKGTGCNIYDTRPESCRVYECVWLRTQKLDRPMAPEIRPDKSHVVIGTLNHGNEIVLYVKPAHRDAWKAPALASALGLFISRGIPIHVSCNDELTRVF